MAESERRDESKPPARLLERREVLGLLGAAAAWLTACKARLSSPLTPRTPASSAQGPPQTATPGPAGALPRCIVRPSQTEGPYFVDEKLNRSDIRSDPSDGSMKAGARLSLSFNAGSVSAGKCSPLSGATIDVWHCDALGVYSDARDPSFSTTGKKFLRGYQPTDSNGTASFTTIYPGWYQGRTVHIHFKIRTSSGGASSEFTSQLYFDDALTDRVHSQPPYSSKGRRSVRNADDGIFPDGGSSLILDVKKDGDGYKASFDIGLMA